MASVIDEQVQQFARLFAGRTDAAGRLKANGTSYQEKCAVTLQTYRTHLDGVRWPLSSLGIYPLTDDGLVVWGACDIDLGDEASAWKVADAFERHGVRAHVEVSKGKGHHVWCFVSEPVPGYVMRAFLRRCAAEAGVTVETFPKQDRVTAGNPFGNFLHLPYPGHPEAAGGRYFIGRDGRQWTCAEFLDRCEYATLPAWASAATPLPHVRTDRLLHGTYNGERPACVRALLNGPVPEGQRNEALARLAAHVINTEGDPQGEGLARDTALGWGLPVGEVTRTIRSFQESGKQYGCDGKREVGVMRAACVYEACPFHRSPNRERIGPTFRLASPKTPTAPAEDDTVALAVEPDDLLGLVAPHGFIRHYVDYCTTLSDAPPVAHLAAALVLVATALGNRVQALSFGGNYIRPNLWVTFIAPSGARKSSVMSRAIATIRQLPQSHTLLLSNSGSKEAWFQQLQSFPTRLLRADEFVGLLAQLDRKHMASAKQFLTECFASNFVTDSTIGRGDGAIVNPALSIIAGCTQSELEQFARREDFASGFLARFLFLPAGKEAAAPRLIPQPRPDVEAAIVQRLAWIGTLSGTITFDDAINARLCAWADQFKQQERHNAGDAMGQLNRAFDFAIKLAMVMQVSETEPGAALWRDLDPDVVERAITLTEWLIRRTMRLVTHELAATEHERDVREVLRAVERAGGTIGRRALRRAIRHLKTRDFDDVVQQLLEGDELEMGEQSTAEGGRGGRPVTIYRLTGNMTNSGPIMTELWPRDLDRPNTENELWPLRPRDSTPVPLKRKDVRP